MDMAINIIIGLLCLPLLGLGFKSLFDAKGMQEHYGVTANNSNGFNTIRGHLGGTLIASAVMIIMGLWTGDKTWFMAAAVFMGVVAVARLIGFVFDGVAKEAIPAVVVELVIVGLMFIA